MNAVSKMIYKQLTNIQNQFLAVANVGEYL